MDNAIIVDYDIPASLAGKRLDFALASLSPTWSRVQWRKRISGQCIQMNGKLCQKPDVAVAYLDHIQACFIPPSNDLTPSPIPLSVLYEDEDVLVINKPAYIVVHPTTTEKNHTILNALLYAYPESVSLERLGLIHRLDKDTSGCLLVAKNNEAYLSLIESMKKRKIIKYYLLCAMGETKAEDYIHTCMERDPFNRKKMRVSLHGKEAITTIQALEYFPDYTYLRARIITGRTHQLRVHMFHIHHPIIADKVYGGKQPQYSCPRQALHAENIQFIHPRTKKMLSIHAPVPEDIQSLLI